LHDVQRAIARIAARQDNVISREQLMAAGLGRGAIAHRVRTGAWRRMHNNVYLLGPAPPSLMARARAAVMACGPDAVVSHRSAAVTKMRGVPVTSVARIIADLAATEPQREVEHAYQEALYRRIVTPRAVNAVIEREPRRRGAPVIRALIEDPRMTRSDRERALLKLLARAQLPKPLTNVRLHGYLVDAYWPEHGLVLEFDGWQAHGHRGAFDRDRSATR